jgi:hypothetical protein
MRHRFSPILVLLLMPFVIQSGCGQPSGPERIDISGKVTFNRQPIADGEISFHPDQGSSGPPTSGTIQNGEYSLGSGWGIVPGTYRVMIRAYRAPPPSASNLIQPGVDLDRPPETPGIPRRDQFLPEKFNTQSTIEKLVVAPGQKSIEQHYDLKE